MKRKAVILFSIGMIVLINLRIIAQESINVSGGDATGSTGKSSYSVGQVFFGYLSGNNTSILEGVQQPYETSIITETEEGKNINLCISVFPNPTFDILILCINEQNYTNLNYFIYDIKGELQHQGQISDKETSIRMASYVSGIYFIKITKGNKEIKVFKVVKN